MFLNTCMCLLASAGYQQGTIKRFLDQARQQISEGATLSQNSSESNS